MDRIEGHYLALPTVPKRTGLHAINQKRITTPGSNGTTPGSNGTTPGSDGTTPGSDGTTPGSNGTNNCSS